MNIKTRDQFKKALVQIDKATRIVIDTETNTLRVRQKKNPLVSIQVYLPEYKQSYNFSFRHGWGDMVLNEGTELTLEECRVLQVDRGDFYNSLTYQDQNTIRLGAIYHAWLQGHEADLGNLPIEWLDELKSHMTPDKTYLYHNANFDLAVLHVEGFPEQRSVQDTMIALQIAWGDWGGKRSSDDKGIKVSIPSRYFDADSADRNGKEWGNRKLKWQARYWNLDNADAGETDLEEGMDKLVQTLADFAVTQAETGDLSALAWVDGCTYASWEKDPESTDMNGTTWHDRVVEKLAKKINSNSNQLKGRIWMLPSDYVTKYGELDVILTSQLHDKLMPIIEGWGCEPIYAEMTAINLELCWRMEQNGVLIDMEEANRRIRENSKKMSAIMGKYTWNIDSWQEFKALIGDALGLPNTQADTVRGALEWINPEEVYWLNDDEGVAGEYAIEVINDRLEYKRLSKQTATYLQRWVDAADPDGYGHFQIDPVGTKTGRATSGGDMGNGQNIPDRSTTIKEVIITPENHLVFGADYSNLELRVGAWMAETLLELDPHMNMTTVINREDAHAFAANMLGVRELLYPNMSDAEIADYNNVPGWKTMNPDKLHKVVFKNFIRQVGKTLNFTLMYGGTHWAVGLRLGLEFTDWNDPKDVQAKNNEQWDKIEVLWKKWRQLFPAFHKAQEHYEEEAMTQRPTPAGTGAFQYNITPIPYYRSQGKPVTEFRMGRPIKHHLYDRDRWVKDKYTGQWENVDIMAYSAKKAWNNAVQGASGIICLHSGWRFYKQPSNATDGVKLFVNIHDALDGYAHTDKLDQVVNLIGIMEDWHVEPKLDVEIEAGLDNWQHMREVKNLELWVDSKGREGYAR